MGLPPGSTKAHFESTRSFLHPSRWIVLESEPEPSPYLTFMLSILLALGSSAASRSGWEKNTSVLSMSDFREQPEFQPLLVVKDWVRFRVGVRVGARVRVGAWVRFRDGLRFKVGVGDGDGGSKRHRRMREREER